MTYTSEQFNNGNGDMSKESFVSWANRVGIMDAVWLAKYFGVALNTVKEWVSEYMENAK